MGTALRLLYCEALLGQAAGQWSISIHAQSGCCTWQVAVPVVAIAAGGCALRINCTMVPWLTLESCCSYTQELN